MQKSLSYLLPLVALLIVIVLIFRWYNTMRPDGEISGPAEGIEISDLTEGEISPMGIEDAVTIPLQPSEESTEEATVMSGEVRLGSADATGGTPFSIFTSLPELENEAQHYQVWFEGERGQIKAMRLSFKKGGYMGEGKLSSEFSQVNVIISRETNDDNQVETVLMTGTVDLTTDEAEVELN